jgi:hypothetical protein
VQEIATVPMNEPDEGMNMMVFNAEKFLTNDHQMKVLQNSRPVWQRSWQQRRQKRKAATMR